MDFPCEKEVFIVWFNVHLGLYFKS